jgi:lauroyl/myristoyl acyltransferase
MDAIVGGTGWEGDLDRLAFRHLCAWARGWELTGRPWLLKNMRVQGVEALHDVEPGRGVVFSAPHFGPLVGMAALPQHVGPVHVAVGEHQVADLPAGYDGYQIEQVRRYMRECDLVPVRAIGSARTFTEVLKGGGRVLLNLDVPGRTPVLSLGEMVELMNGTVRLAQSTDSVVVPVIPLARGRRWYLHVAAPIDSRNYPAREDLLQAIVTSIEELILRAPEYLENPLRDGGWAVATRDGWRRSA